MKSIIEVIHGDEPPQGHSIVQKVTGKDWVKKPLQYRNMETDERYCHIAGGVAFPSKNLPGFAVVVGVLDGPLVKEPQIKVIEEYEGPATLGGFVQGCMDLHTKWWFPHIPFYGNHERYHQQFADLNKAAKQKDPENFHSFHLQPPHDFNQPDKGIIYLERIKEVLTPDKNRVKKLVLGNCGKLIGHMQSLMDSQTQGNIEEVPAVAALGFAVHTMMSHRPWLMSTEGKPSRYIQF